MMNLDPLSLWIVLGLILITAEMLTAGFFLLFIAVGCFAAALASSFFAPFWMQILICAFISIIGVLTLRKPILKRMLKSIKLEADIGKEIRADEDIEAHQQKRITYQGSTWVATNVGLEKIVQGDHVTIVGIDGNVLLIRKNN